MSVVFTFNTVTSTTMGLTVIDILKPIMPPQKVTNIDIPMQSGSVQSSKKFTQNEIVVKCLLKGTSYADLITKLKALAGYLYSDDDKVLSFDDETDRYYNAQHTDTVIGKRTYMYAFLDLVFTCNDPFAYDTTPTTDTQVITVLDTTYTLNNAGQYDAYPVITITFNAAQTHVYVENTSVTENRFDISNNFMVDDQLEIDCKNKTVKLNDVTDYTGVGDGGETLAEWLVLKAGDNVISVGSDDVTIDVDVEFIYSKTYLY